jgi:hypothetical protein
MRADDYLTFTLLTSPAIFFGATDYISGHHMTLT